MGISEEVLEEIGADVEQAVKSIAAKYGMSIRYRGVDGADEWGNGDKIKLEVVPLSEDELSQEARGSSYWKVFLGNDEGTDDDAR
ncbi:hypothetical protein [Rhizobium leguminosarum]|jgi:hypothetical protein|uniref:hypothetical protein n=1 Tax=Rhizobium leguminosarum TaxID=384 RepID=UPI002E0FF4D4|nr:hypothetical protein U8Q02_39640 [Rhizobium leguminosarum]